MTSVFLREQKRYTQDNLVTVFNCSEEKAVRILRRMKEYGVLKAVKATDIQKDLTDLVDEEIEIADVEVGENEYLYVFTFSWSEKPVAWLAAGISAVSGLA